MERRNFLQFVAGAAATTALSKVAPAADKPGSARRPNILLIMSDDQGWGDIRSHGNDQIDTPVMDRLATQGAEFDRFYVCSVCAPTRASLLTGRYHLATGVCGVTRGLETMRADETTIAAVLKQAGYATGAFGKWHNGMHYPNHPNGQGFQEYLGFCGGHWNNYFDTTLDHNGAPTKVKGFITDVLADAAMAFMEKNRERPFFCYLPFNAPHGPFQVPDKYFDKYKARGLTDQLAAVYGMVENVDENIGRLLKKVDDLGLANDTIVLFLTDNGPNGDRFNGGMRGRKGAVDEGGIRVPLFVRWPGRIAPGARVAPLAAHIDLMPTLLELCGVALPSDLDIHGMSLAPLLAGQTANWPERMIFSHHANGPNPQPFPGAVRTQQHRLVRRKKGAWELYDMAADPGQTKDIAAEQPEIAKRLTDAYEKWFAEMTRKPIVRMPIAVGHSESPVVEIPAPEAYFGGNIVYKGKNGYANDWLTNWTSTDDQVWWEIDVVRPGRHEITLMYTCPEKNIGSKIRVEIGGEAVEGQITRAHDPAPLPSPDRVPRGEVYEKVWAPLTLGTVNLKPGQTRIQIKALTKPGESVMDLKAVILKQVG